MSRSWHQWALPFTRGSGMGYSLARIGGRGVGEGKK
ncbi:MAG: hypothetical protein RL341_478 [Pseudomonadota bacterium]